MPFKLHSKGTRHYSDLAIETALTAISRYKHFIGATLKSRHDTRRATEVAIAIESLNRVNQLGHTKFIRVA